MNPSYRRRLAQAHIDCLSDYVDEGGVDASYAGVLAETADRLNGLMVNATEKDVLVILTKLHHLAVSVHRQFTDEQFWTLVDDLDVALRADVDATHAATQPLAVGLDRNEVGYLAGLVGSNIRKKRKAIVKFRPKHDQSPQDAGEALAHMTRQLAYAEAVHGKLKAAMLP